MAEDLEKLHGDHKIPLKELLRRSIKYSKGVRHLLVFAFLLLIISVAINVVLPLFIKEFVNHLKQDDPSKIVLWTALWLVIGYAGLGIFTQILRYFQALLLQKAGQEIVFKLRMEVFVHIENMSLNQFNDMAVGALVTRVANYTSSMSELFTDVLITILSDILLASSVFVVMMVISWKLSLVLLIFVALAFLVTLIFGRKIGGMFRKERKQVSDLNTFLSENLSGMRIIQIFNKEKDKIVEFDEKNEALAKSMFNVVLIFTFYRPLLNVLYYGAVASTFGFGILFMLNAGEIASFYLFLSNFFNPIQDIADKLNQVTRALTACERLFNLLDVEPEVIDSEDAIDIDHFEGKIEFRNVWFAYEKDNWILKDVSFVVNPKQTVAFVGATGAGKTTILSLIVRNFEIQKGQILIDDIDIKKIKIESLRRAIGQMLQDVFLFSGTIKTNITLHDESFTDEEVWEACDYVNASTFINRQENKLDQEVVERGENFSSGQRQLLSFARTVLHKPQILILDEATANIDTETEVLIQESLLKIKEIGTMLVVAHRLSTIQHADNIIVLQNGQIIETGTHQSLLKNKGYYYKLYQLQFESHH